MMDYMIGKTGRVPSIWPKMIRIDGGRGVVACSEVRRVEAEVGERQVEERRENVVLDGLSEKVLL